LNFLHNKPRMAFLPCAVLQFQNPKLKKYLDLDIAGETNVIGCGGNRHGICAE